jgi:hypothetical protein
MISGSRTLWIETQPAPTQAAWVFHCPPGRAVALIGGGDEILGRAPRAVAVFEQRLRIRMGLEAPAPATGAGAPILLDNHMPQAIRKIMRATNQPAVGVAAAAYASAKCQTDEIVDVAARSKCALGNRLRIAVIFHRHRQSEGAFQFAPDFSAGPIAKVIRCVNHPAGTGGRPSPQLRFRAPPA